MPLKSNRNVALSEQDKRDGHLQPVQTLSLEHGEAQQVYLEQVGFPLLLVKQVFTNKDSSQGLLYLVSSDMTLDGDHIAKAELALCASTKNGGRWKSTTSP